MTRAARLLVGMIVAPRQTQDRLAQYRMVARGRRTFAANGLEARLRGLMAEAFKPKYDDLIRLWDLVCEKRPAFILEYGSGCSTLVMAAALEQNRREGKGTGRLLAIEGYGKWWDHTYSHLTESERIFVEVRVLQPQIVKRSLKLNKDGEVAWYSIKKGDDVMQGVVGLIYPELHDLAPDMIYLDGPDPESVPGYVDSKGVVLPAIVFDFLDMEDRLPQNTTLVIDGRDSNAMVLRNNLNGNWSVEVLGWQKCTVLRRREKS